MIAPHHRFILRHQGGFKEQARRLVALKNAMTDDFATAMNVLRSDRRMTIEKLAESASLSERTIQRMCKPSNSRHKLENVLRVCFALNLEPELSEKLLSNAGTPLMNTQEDMVYRMLLRDCFDSTLEEIDDILVSEGMPPLSQSA